MKTIKNILLTTLLASAFIACENDDFGPVEGTVTPTEQVEIGFTDSNDNAMVLEAGGTVTYDIALSKPIQYDGVVSLSVTSSDDSLETTPGVTEVSYGEATIPAGSTTASITLTFSDDTIVDPLETYTVTLSNFVTTETLTEQFITPTTLEENRSRKVGVYDVLPIVINTEPGDVEINLDWRSSEDLDLYLRDQPTVFSTVLGNSWFSQPENITMAGTLADGDYYIGLDNFNVPTPYNVPCTFKLVFPDGNEEILLSALETTDSQPANGEPDIWFKVSKTTNGSNVTYTILQL